MFEGKRSGVFRYPKEHLQCVDGAKLLRHRPRREWRESRCSIVSYIILLSECNYSRTLGTISWQAKKIPLITITAFSVRTPWRFFGSATAPSAPPAPPACTPAPSGLGYNPLVLQPTCRPTAAHWPYSPLVLKPVGPTAKRAISGLWKIQFIKRSLHFDKFKSKYVVQ